MKKIVRLLSPKRNSVSKKIEQILKGQQFFKKGPLDHNFQQNLIFSVKQITDDKKFLEEMISLLRSEQDEGRIIKIFTIIHNFIQSNNYKRDVILCLQDIQVQHIGSSIKDLWFREFCTAYCTYLVKLPSLSDIYSKTHAGNSSVSLNNHLIQLFRITNTVSILFPTLTNAINFAGRYLKNSMSEMDHLFKVISLELSKVYRYIKNLVAQIFSQYRTYKKSQIQCFIDSIAEISLICDKIADFILCKYFNGSMIFEECNFDEEKISELQFYISQLRQKEENGSVSTTTNENQSEEEEQDLGQSHKPLVAAAYDCSFGIGLTQ